MNVDKMNIFVTCQKIIVKKTFTGCNFFGAMIVLAV